MAPKWLLKSAFKHDHKMWLLQQIKAFLNYTHARAVFEWPMLTTNRLPQVNTGVVASNSSYPPPPPETCQLFDWDVWPDTDLCLPQVKCDASLPTTAWTSSKAPWLWTGRPTLWTTTRCCWEDALWGTRSGASAWSSSEVNSHRLLAC